MVSSGMYALVLAILLTLCGVAAWHLHKEKSLVEELMEDLKAHPSHKNVKAFMLAKKLVEQKSAADMMAFADHDGSEKEKEQEELARQKLQSMFRGYRLKVNKGTTRSAKKRASDASQGNRPGPMEIDQGSHKEI